MTFQRGDVILARVPHVAGTRGKKRPAVIIQSDAYNAQLRHAVVAEVTSNPRWIGDPACVVINLSTPEGRATGLHQDAVVSCFHLVTISVDRLSPPIGRLSPTLLQLLDASLKTALGLS